MSESWREPCLEYRPWGNNGRRDEPCGNCGWAYGEHTNPITTTGTWPPNREGNRKWRRAHGIKKVVS